MSTPQYDDDNQLKETQLDESQSQLETQNFEDEEMIPPESGSPHASEDVERDVELEEQPKPKKRAKEKVDLDREPGSSLLPIARVQKIIKADQEIPIVAKEATFLISLATEEFIKRLVEACYVASLKEKRGTIQHKDLVAVTRKADEFLFLEDIVQWANNEPSVKKAKPKTKATSDNEKPNDGKTKTLHEFGIGRKINDTDAGEDIIMNTDGTMYAAGNSDDDL